MVSLYHRMRGLNWSALEWLLAVEGVDDVEMVVQQLIELDRRLRENG